MVPQDAINVARASAVLVQVQGPDPKGRKMSRHAFFHSESGQTTLSASGLLILNEAQVGAPKSLTVITCASIVDPFIAQKSSDDSGGPESPKLIYGAKLDVLVEIPSNSMGQDSGDQCFCWVSAELVALVDIPEAGKVLQGLLDVHGGSVDGIWDVGWSLVPSNENVRGQGLGRQTSAGQSSSVERGHAYGEPASNMSRQRGGLGLAATRVAVLRLCALENQEVVASLGQVGVRILELQESFSIHSGLPLATLKTRGDFVVAVGSPFGALSPLHFHNSMSVGFVANRWPRSSLASSLLMVDLRCLPGMEGGPVFDEHGGLVGLVTRPLRQRISGAEVQLVTTSDALAGPLQLAGVHLGSPLLPQASATIADHRLQRTGGKTLQAGACMGLSLVNDHRSYAPNSMSPAIEGAVASVVLITVGDGAWASGVLLNAKGLILTNAHLLEPWRFVKTRPSQSSIVRGLGSRADEKHGAYKLEKSELPGTECGPSQGTDPFCIDVVTDCYGLSDKMDERLPEKISRVVCNITDGSSRPGRVINGSGLRPSGSARKSNQPIRVRIDDLKLGSCSWHGAKAVFVSQGPLDIALLQLESVPANIHPITPEKRYPSVGSTAVVIGHGLFGPRWELCPSVSAGVVARVVKTGATTLSRVALQEPRTDMPNCAAMLETTAAVHPGGSGGAVVNAEGRMIGLVTSNTRHSGGTVIPNLNFSVPCAALSTVFEFAAEDQVDPSVLLKLDEPNEQLSAVWALVPPPSKRPSPLTSWPPSVPIPQPSESSVEKGSKFARFLSDKVAELSITPRAAQFESQLRPHSILHTAAEVSGCCALSRL